MSSSKETRFYGYLAEFETVNGLVDACAAIRDAGYTRWDAHTPFPVHGLDGAMGLRTTKLPWVVFFSGLTGAGLGLLLQYWTSAVDYPLIISGKPLFSIPANVPITFEMTILFSALSAFIGMLAFNGLPQFYHPVFHSERFRRATDDRFFITVEARDPRFREDDTRSLLESLGPVQVERLEED
ncbi:MAG: DUF3341 domain-containing protein [Candidatus Krumholzibacteriia bacterium]|nr:DUF3341 domain-containing protein [bacterium]MCB9514321.1 DUF3341 domain-containing protein [Candidatus Latescibacterota bacterium]MCB9516757.1 DUF3341 domain-containing protein [Candidatus Latescibacterota bacterium]